MDRTKILRKINGYKKNSTLKWCSRVTEELAHNRIVSRICPDNPNVYSRGLLELREKKKRESERISLTVEDTNNEINKDEKNDEKRNNFEKYKIRVTRSFRPILFRHSPRKTEAAEGNIFRRYDLTYIRTNPRLILGRSWPWPPFYSGIESRKQEGGAGSSELWV